MFKQIFVFPLCGMVPVGLCLAVTFAETPSPKGNYAPVNGLKMYYEIHGKANDKNPALVLLHGGVGATEMFGPNLPALSKTRQVIAADLQAHGRTADIDRPLSIELMADDVAALIKHLGIEKADVMGYSLGGGVALQTAIRYPGAVRKLVVGDADAVRTAHSVEFFGLLGGAQRDGGWDGSGRPNAQLAILPGTTHYDIFVSPALASTATQFLDAPMPNTK